MIINSLAKSINRTLPMFSVCVCVCVLSHVRLLATPWTAAYEAPLSMGFSRQEYWSGVPLPSPNIHFRLTKFTLLAISSVG